MFTHFLFEFVTWSPFYAFVFLCSVQNKATWSRFSIHFFDSCKPSKISVSMHCSKPLHVAVSFLSFQSKDSYFSSTHSHLSVAILQVNNYNATSSMQICENVAAEEEKNNEKKGDPDGLHHFPFPLHRIWLSFLDAWWTLEFITM